MKSSWGVGQGDGRAATSDPRRDPAARPPLGVPPPSRSHLPRPPNREQILQAILDSGIIAIIRAPSSDSLLDTARALVAGGVTSIEVTMTTPNALAGITTLADQLSGRATIGVGTVLDAATCRDAIAAGAQYVVSPHFDPEVIATTRRYWKVSLPGAFTPTEILAAWTAGADLVKVFPSAVLGPTYIRDVLAPLPQLRLIPTGGVDAGNVADWFRAGAACVGAGSSLLPKDALARGDWGAITSNARAFVEAVKRARGR